jgi:hypothetical protein
MPYRPDIDDKLCFVLMPFGEPFNGYYGDTIKPAVEATGLYARRADEIYRANPIMRDVTSVRINGGRKR